MVITAIIGRLILSIDYKKKEMIQIILDDDINVLFFSLSSFARHNRISATPVKTRQSKIITSVCTDISLIVHLGTCSTIDTCTGGKYV